MKLRFWKAKVLRCSFCGKSQHDVMKLIGGPKVYICDECVDVCLSIIMEDKAAEAREQAEQPLPEPAK